MMNLSLNLVCPLVMENALFVFGMKSNMINLIINLVTQMMLKAKIIHGWQLIKVVHIENGMEIEIMQYGGKMMVKTSEPAKNLR